MEAIGAVYIAKENAHSVEMIARQSIEGGQSVEIDVVDPRQNNSEHRLVITFSEALGKDESRSNGSSQFNVVVGSTQAGERVIISLGEQASREQRRPTVILHKPAH